ncbi:IclR family transcriptional regulator [Actinomadura chibensis]|uniref:IclR family transcriptional regulator n=1 Tax=Actinomadura chibensis TaxID=392828 RepID=UPI00082F9741|nr:IclR family transcriptional regulator [Actinomadura chibensis]
MQSVSRALAVLDTVAEAGAPPRAQEIATRLGLNLTTVVHLLNTLVEGGYLTKRGRTYSWSRTKILDLHGRLAPDAKPSPAALAALQRAVQATGESGYVSNWTGDDVVIAAVAEGDHAVRVAGLRVGLSGDVHARASGKCLLAFGPPARAANYLDTTSLIGRTPATIVERDALEKELAETRRRGYSIDREEYLQGVCGIAVPLREGQWANSALALTMPVDRFHTNRTHLIDVLQEVADTAHETH